MVRIFVWRKNGEGAGVERMLFLDPSSVINFKISNPLVSDLGTFSFPITLPYEENKHIFDFPGIGQAREYNYAFRMTIGNDFFLDGDVEIIDATGIQIYLKSGNSSVASIQNNSMLNKDINGQSWGEIDDEDLTDSLQGCFPEYEYVATPIKWDSGLDEPPFINPSNVAIARESRSNFPRARYGSGIYNKVSMNRTGVIQLDLDSLCPAVYVRYLIDRIISGCNFQKDRDDLAVVPDANRLFLFSAKSNANLTDIATWLPSISVRHFLKSLEARFGIYLYFSPVSRFCSVVLADNISTVTPRLWDNRFISNEESERYSLKTIHLLQDGPETDVSDSGLLDVNPDYIVSFFDQLPDPNRPLSEDVVTLLTESEERTIISYVSSLDRFFKKTLFDPGNDFPKNIDEVTEDNGFFLTKNLFPLDNSYYQIKHEEPPTSTIEISNTSTGALSDNIIAQWAFTAPLIDNRAEIRKVKRAFGITIGVKVNSGQSWLIAELASYNIRTNTSTVVGRGIFRIENASMQMRRFFFRTSQELVIQSTNRIYLRLYSSSPVAGRTITVKFGGKDSTKFAPIASHVYIDPSFYEWREVSAMSPYKYGEKSDPDMTIKPSGFILNNDFTQMSGVFEFPVTTMKPEIQQKDFAFSIYRGLRKEISDPGDRIAGYASFDNVALDQQPYTLENGEPSPQLTLRWNEQSGIVNTFMKDILFRKRHAWRRETKKFKLSMFDITSHPLFVPVSVAGQSYLIAELTVPIHVTRGLGEVTAELLTI